MPVETLNTKILSTSNTSSVVHHDHTLTLYIMHIACHFQILASDDILLLYTLHALSSALACRRSQKPATTSLWPRKPGLTCKAAVNTDANLLLLSSGEGRRQGTVNNKAQSRHPERSHMDCRHICYCSVKVWAGDPKANGLPSSSSRLLPVALCEAPVHALHKSFYEEAPLLVVQIPKQGGALRGLVRARLAAAAAHAAAQWLCGAMPLPAVPVQNKMLKHIPATAWQIACAEPPAPCCCKCLSTIPAITL